MSPADESREGYAPNVVYTCGALAVGRCLLLPHGVSDSCTQFCWLNLNEVVVEPV